MDVKQIALNEESVKNKIFSVRGVQIILDRDLAELYQVETKVLNQAVKRNFNRFPLDFMFKLTESEKIELVTNCDRLEPLKHSSSSPYAFTEQGVAMLSGVLKSKTAIKVSIQIMSAFVVMRQFLQSNAQIFQRLDRVEIKQLEQDQKFNYIFKSLEMYKPKQGIFFDGQIFDAYKFVSDLIRNANTSITVIDNYVDESVLTLFSKTKAKVIIYTKLTNQLKLDLKKYDSQYNNVQVKEFTKSHDRFLIIDEEEMYHFGASLKDLGKKWFAFSKFDKDSLKILNKLKGFE